MTQPATADPLTTEPPTDAEMVALRLSSEAAERVYKSRKGEAYASISSVRAKRAWILAKAAYAAGAAKYYARGK